MLDSLMKIQYYETNYKIEEISRIKKCLIFCSSNGFWQPHNVDVFTKKVMEQDYYEWQNIAQHKYVRMNYGRIIYVRDIYKHFYVEGINDKLNSIEKIARFIESKVQGYEVTTVGNSAGGYLACILGARLGAKRVYSFGGQFNLRTWSGANNNYKFSDFEFLSQYAMDEQRTKYFDIRKYIYESKVPVYHFYSGRNVADSVQVEGLRGIENIYLFKFSDSTHGTTVCGFNLPYILTEENDFLNGICEQYRDKFINKYLFSVSLIGVFKTFWLILKKIMKRVFDR